MGKFGPDLGQTSDVALGLAATGGQAATLAKVLSYLETHGAAYVQGDPSTGEKAGAHYAGSTGKLALVAQATGKNPSSFGGFDLISEIRKLMGKDGRFRDDSQFGDFSNPLGQSFDILALKRGAPEGAPKRPSTTRSQPSVLTAGSQRRSPRPARHVLRARTRPA